jgi:anti-anti-sigma factor
LGVSVILLKTDLVTTSGVSTLFVAGEIDIAVRERFTDALFEAVDSATLTLLVDLGEVEFIDSSGMKCLIDTCRRCYERGIGFRVSRLSTRAARTFEIVGLGDMLCGAPVSELAPQVGSRSYS